MPPSRHVREPRDHRQHGGLAASRMPDERNELALADVEREPVDHRQRPLRRRKASWRRCRTPRTCRGSRPPWCALTARTAFGTKSLEVIGMTSGSRTRLSSGCSRCCPASMRYCVISRAQMPILRHRDSRRAGRAAAASGTRNSRPSVARGAGSQRNDAVGEQQRFIHIVRHHHDGLALVAPQRFDLVLQARARERVQRAQRLIEQQDLRIRRERARHGDALAHAAGELRRPPVGRVRQADELDVLRDMLAPLLLRPLRKHGVHRERDVPLHGQPRHERVALEHDAAIGPGAGHALAPAAESRPHPARAARRWWR